MSSLSSSSSFNLSTFRATLHTTNNKTTETSYFATFAPTVESTQFATITASFKASIRAANIPSLPSAQ